MTQDWNVIEEVLTRDELIVRLVETLPPPELPENSDIPPSACMSISPEDAFESMEIDEPRWRRDEPPRPQPPPPWSVGFSRQFKRDTSALDRKLLGKVLEVLEEITDYKLPFQTSGDTFKPLSGEFAGCWRYRIGDNRLVIRPVRERAQIDVLMFGARGSVYG